MECFIEENCQRRINKGCKYVCPEFKEINMLTSCVGNFQNFKVS